MPKREKRECTAQRSAQNPGRACLLLLPLVLYACVPPATDKREPSHPETGRYEARCDGRSDDTAALERAVASEATVTLSGACRISRPLKLRAGTTLQGAAGASLGPTDGYQGTDLVEVINAPDVTITGIELNGRRAELGRKDAYDGVYVFGSPRVTIQRSIFHGFSRFGVSIRSRSHEAKVLESSFYDIQPVVGASGVVVAGSLDGKQVVNNALVQGITCQTINPRANEAANGTDDGNCVYIGPSGNDAIVRQVTAKDIGRRCVKIQASNVLAEYVRGNNCGHSVAQLGVDGGPEIPHDIVLHDLTGVGGTYGVTMENVARVTLNGFDFSGQYNAVDIRNQVTDVTIKNGTIANSEKWGVRMERVLNGFHGPIQNIYLYRVLIDNTEDAAIGIRDIPGSSDGPVSNVTLQEVTTSHLSMPSLSVWGPHTGIKLIRNNWASPLYLDPAAEIIQ